MQLPRDLVKETPMFFAAFLNKRLNALASSRAAFGASGICL
jgi:hypothetical protein